MESECSKKKREGKKNELARGSYVFHLVTFSIRTLSRFAIIKTSKQYPANNGSIFIPTKQPTKFLRSLRPPNSLSIGSQSVNRIPFVPRSIIAIDREKKFWPSRVPLRASRQTDPLEPRWTSIRKLTVRETNGRRRIYQCVLPIAGRPLEFSKGETTRWTEWGGKKICNMAFPVGWQGFSNERSGEGEKGGGKQLWRGGKKKRKRKKGKGKNWKERQSGVESLARYRIERNVITNSRSTFRPRSRTGFSTSFVSSPPPSSRPSSFRLFPVTETARRVHRWILSFNLINGRTDCPPIPSYNR